MSSKLFNDVKVIAKIASDIRLSVERRIEILKEYVPMETAMQLVARS